MPVPKEQIYTIDDIMALPDNQRAELIDGEIFMMAPPKPVHQHISAELFTAINNYIHAHGNQCQANYAPYAVFLNQDDRNYVEPDIFVVCDRNKLSERGCEGAPDWIIEIVSQSTEKMDYGIKLFKYRSAGVKEYWIVNPGKKVVNVYLFGEVPEGRIYSFEEEIPVGLYPGFAVCIEELI